MHTIQPGDDVQDAVNTHSNITFANGKHYVDPPVIVSKNHVVIKFDLKAWLVASDFARDFHDMSTRVTASSSSGDMIRITGNHCVVTRPHINGMGKVGHGITSACEYLTVYDATVRNCTVKGARVSHGGKRPVYIAFRGLNVGVHPNSPTPSDELCSGFLCDPGSKVAHTVVITDLVVGELAGGLPGRYPLIAKFACADHIIADGMTCDHKNYRVVFAENLKRVELSNGAWIRADYYPHPKNGPAQDFDLIYRGLKDPRG